jgi:N-acetylglucosamine kinase
LDLLLGQLQLESVDGLVRIVYDRDLPRHAIAQLASLVQRAWEDQDSVASSLIEDAAEELAIAARAVAGRLALTNTEIPFVLAGGAFQGVPRLTAALTPRLIEIVPRSRTVSLGVEPAMGAVRLALDDARGVANLPRYRAV